MDFIARKLRCEKSKCHENDEKSNKKPHESFLVGGGRLVGLNLLAGLNLVLLSLLAVIGIRTMLAVIVFLY